MPAGKERILNSGSVKVVIHKPLEGSDPVALCNETRNIIADVLNKQGYISNNWVFSIMISLIEEI